MHFKKITQLINYIINQELISIMVNKSRIYKDIQEYFFYFSNSIKLDNELRCKTMDFSIFGKIFLRIIYIIKNPLIWKSIYEKIKE